MPGAGLCQNARWLRSGAQVARGMGIECLHAAALALRWATYRLRGLRRRGLAGLVGRRGVGLVRDGDLDGGRGGGLVVGGDDGHGFGCGSCAVRSEDGSITGP